ncbi:MAG: ADP-ribosylglycohydrolase family protein [Verrucomicrobiota bacterium]
MNLSNEIGIAERAEGMLWGLFIGDALAMPTHWYYDQEQLKADYGEVTDYKAPVNPHPGSILWRSRYSPPAPRADILHDQAKYWGQEDIHYHQFLEAGENTLNAQLCRLLWGVLNDECGWNAEAFFSAYIQFMTTPGMHRDTYVEEAHRVFFRNYGFGKDPSNCAEAEKHVGGLGFLFPVLAYYLERYRLGKVLALKQLELTHGGRLMAEASSILFDVLEGILQGSRPSEAVEAVVATQRSFLLKGSWQKWLHQETRYCMGRAIGTVCYVEYAIPAILYLLWKYGDDPERALIENTMSGGDNCHRGMVLGAILGAAYGVDAFPERWRAELKEPVDMLPRVRWNAGVEAG